MGQKAKTPNPKAASVRRKQSKDGLRGAYGSGAHPGFNVLLFPTDRNKMNSFVSGDTTFLVSLPFEHTARGEQAEN